MQRSRIQSAHSRLDYLSICTLMLQDPEFLAIPLQSVLNQFPVPGGLEIRTPDPMRTMVQILYRAMRSRVAIHGRGGPVSELPFPGLSNEELIQAYKEECENEQQSNPLTYDVALGFSKNLSQPEALSKLARYESALDRSLYRALHELQRLQALRKGTSTGPPAAVDVDLSVSRK